MFFSELYSVPEDMKKGYFKVKILELLMFLNGLDISASQTEQLAQQFHISPTWLKKCFYSVYGHCGQLKKFIKNL